MPYERSLVFLPPMARVWITNMQYVFGWNDEEMERQLVRQMKTFNLPFNLFTIEESAKISILFKNCDNKAIASTYVDAEKGFRSNYPNINIDTDIIKNKLLSLI